MKEFIKESAIKLSLPSSKFRIFLLLSFATVIQAQTVRFHTTLGDIDVILAPETTPLTVANFLDYVNNGGYTNSIFHRSVPGFVIQAGGYTLVGNGPVTSAHSSPVKSEYKTSNTRGTIAMALSGNSAGTDINSATNQWFFNTVDNSGSLDTQKFTVFGQVANDAGLAVMDAIAAVPVYIGSSPVFAQIPLINYNSRGNVVAANYVLVKSIVKLAPAVTAAGFTDSASYLPNATAGIAPGELLTIFGTDLGPSQLATLTLTDKGVVTNTLSNTRVLFDGTPGAMIYTLSGQVSVVAPYNLAGKTSVKVVVEYLGIQTSTIQLPVVTVNPGLFTLDGSGKNDAAIVRNLDGSLVNTAKPAQTGDDLVLYGHGYGIATASTALPDGTIVGAALPIPAVKPVLLIDGKVMDTQYAGGAPSIVNGVLQVNFRLPQLTPGTHQIQIQSGNVKSPAGVTLQSK